jgi:hypothetical protein
VVYCVSFVAEAGRAQQCMFDGTVVIATTNDILHWMTGCKFIPATGIAWKVSVSFDNTRVLPRVSTCGPFVEFPVGPLQHARKSVAVFTCWILDSPGFGQP